MMKKPLEAVITDLDGSLLSNTKEIGTADHKTIATLKGMGIPVFIATGRHQAITRCYAKQVGTALPVITSNGGLLYDFSKEEIVFAKHLSPQDVTELKAFVLNRGLYYFIYSDKQCFLNNSNPDAEFYKMDLELMSIANEDEFEIMSKDFEPTDYNVIKFMIPNCTPEILEELQQLSCMRAGRVVPTYSGDMFLDINPAGVSKGAAAKKLSELYGFSLANTLAMGDNFNDAAMLQAVGYSVVPETAHEGVQALARFVTCGNNENPITHAVNTLFPGLLGN
ncbi:MAG: HAD family hydrolase [Angelakisella sp.]